LSTKTVSSRDWQDDGLPRRWIWRWVGRRVNRAVSKQGGKEAGGKAAVRGIVPKNGWARSERNQLPSAD
jgi:hypothetical protein